MKRHAALQALSREHHTALVLALACTRAASGDGATRLAACERAARQFEAELEPHFRQEEAALLPLLQEAGEQELVRRTLDDHAVLRTLAKSLGEQDTASLAEFARQLSGHVRFEEQTLFPAAELAVPEHRLIAALAAG